MFWYDGIKRDSEREKERKERIARAKRAVHNEQPSARDLLARDNERMTLIFFPHSPPIRRPLARHTTRIHIGGRWPKRAPCMGALRLWFYIVNGSVKKKNERRRRRRDASLSRDTSNAHTSSFSIIHFFKCTRASRGSLFLHSLLLPRASRYKCAECIAETFL